MARLTAKSRKLLGKGSFALPGGGPGGKDAYPIENASHARNALSRVSGNGTPAQKSKVRAAVHRKYPDIGFSRIVRKGK